MTAIVPVILSGGSGTRLWPMSRPERPKQLLALTAEETMLQLTAQRATGDNFAAPIVVGNAAHAEEIETQLEAAGNGAQALILEPAGRNTAPAIALAALALDDRSAPLLVMPSDHVIADVPAFHAAIDAALPLVEQGWLTTFGITPDAPETGYGWIAIGDELSPGIHRVERFVEKPPRADAEAMLAAGGFAWNGGIFLFRADAYLEALAAFAPEILRDCQIAMQQARHEGARVFPDAAAFAACPSDSIDYAVMEVGPRGGRAGRDGLERRRQLGRTACFGARRGQQFAPRRCARAGDHRHPGPDRRAPRGNGRGQRPDRSGVGRRCPDPAPRPQPGR